MMPAPYYKQLVKKYKLANNLTAHAKMVTPQVNMLKIA